MYNKTKTELFHLKPNKTLDQNNCRIREYRKYLTIQPIVPQIRMAQLQLRLLHNKLINPVKLLLKTPVLPARLPQAQPLKIVLLKTTKIPVPVLLQVPVLRPVPVQVQVPARARPQTPVTLTAKSRIWESTPTTYSFSKCICKTPISPSTTPWSR